MVYRNIATLGQRIHQRHGLLNHRGIVHDVVVVVALSPRAPLGISARRMGSSSPSPSKTAAKTASSQQVEKESSTTDAAAAEEKPPEAKGWLKRMAPPKGGTEVPDAKFMAVATVVLGAGYYAWFIDAPTPS
jgi:hypothetical protein